MSISIIYAAVARCSSFALFYFILQHLKLSIESILLLSRLFIRCE